MRDIEDIKDQHDGKLKECSECKKKGIAGIDRSKGVNSDFFRYIIRCQCGFQIAGDKWKPWTLGFNNPEVVDFLGTIIREWNVLSMGCKNKIVRDKKTSIGNGVHIKCESCKLFTSSRYFCECKHISLCRLGFGVSQERIRDGEWFYICRFNDCSLKKLSYGDKEKTIDYFEMIG